MSSCLQYPALDRIKKTCDNACMDREKLPECDAHDYECALHPRPFAWLCPVCLQDISLGYTFWAEEAHPEWFDGLDAVSPPAPADIEGM